MESRRIPPLCLFCGSPFFSSCSFGQSTSSFDRRTPDLYTRISIFFRGFGGTIICGIGVAELFLLLGFVIGFAARVTYGLVFLLHAGSTFSSFRQYLHPFEGSNILFFAAWPMLGACFTLYYLRDLDTLWSVRGKKG